MNRQTQAYIYAISTVLLWSTVATAFKITLRYLDVWQLLFVSSLTATLCLLLVLLILGKYPLLYKLKQKTLVRLLGFGLLNPFCYYLILFKAYDLLPAQVAQALNYTWAITLMLLSIPVLKQKVTRHDWTATVICYAGVVVICLGANQFPAGNLSVLGIILALGSTIVWALYWIFKARDKVDPVVGIFLSFLFSLPFVTGACYLFSSLSIWSVYGLAGGIYVGLFEMGITFVLWLTALRLTSATAKVSTLIFLSPFLSLVIIHNFVGEPIAHTTVLGLLFIVFGLLVQRRDKAAV